MSSHKTFILNRHKPICVPNLFMDDTSFCRNRLLSFKLSNSFFFSRKKYNCQQLQRRKGIHSMRSTSNLLHTTREKTANWAN